MATEAQLKKNIADIKAGLRSKVTDVKTKEKLKFQLSKLTKELEDLKKPAAKPTPAKPATATKEKTQTALQKLKELIKKNEKFKGYKRSGIDIEKDAARPALPAGIRISKKSGEPYREVRLNRSDVKQPPKKYPKLENGGELKKKSLTNEFAKGGEIATTILSQLGGSGKLIAMTGAYNFVDLGNGVSFKIKNPKANYIKVTLNGKDLYDLEIGRIRGDKYTIVKEANDVYFDQLKELIERGTGMYLSLFDLGGDVRNDDDDNDDNGHDEMAKGGLFDVSKSYRPTGRAWTKEHYNINRSEKNEVPLSERKHEVRNRYEQGGLFKDDAIYAKGGNIGEVKFGLMYVAHSDVDADRFEKLLDNSDFYAERDSLSFNFPVEDWDVDVTEMGVQELLNNSDVSGHWESYDKMAKGGETEGYETWEMLVVFQESEKQGGEILKDTFLVSAKDFNEAKDKAIRLWENSYSSGYDISIVEVLALKHYPTKAKSKHKDDGGKPKANEKEGYENWEMLVVFQESEKQGGEILNDKFLVSAKDFNEAKNKAIRLWENSYTSGYDISIVEVLALNRPPTKAKSKNEDGGMMEKGGVLDINDLKKLQKKYDRNEDNNYHSENVVLLAEYFGTDKDLAEAKAIQRRHDKEGHMSLGNMRERDNLYFKLLDRWKQTKKKLGMMADGGYMAKGGKLSQKPKYVHNRLIQEVEVERNGKTTYIDGADVLDGIYVKKGVKYEGGGEMHRTQE